MLSASAKFWRELDTYKVGTVRQSDSLMHRLLSRGPFTEAEFDVSEEFRQSPTFKTYFTLLNELWHDWKAEGGRRNDRQSQKWQHMQDFVIASYVYTSQFTLNYEVMRNIYSQRKNHRMASQWRAFFDEVLVRLPFSEIVTEDLPFLGDTSPFGLRSLAAWHTTPRA
jgi:hypothetical protein